MVQWFDFQVRLEAVQAAGWQGLDGSFCEYSLTGAGPLRSLLIKGFSVLKKKIKLMVNIPVFEKKHITYTNFFYQYLLNLLF